MLGPIEISVLYVVIFPISKINITNDITNTYDITNTFTCHNDINFCLHRIMLEL